MRMFAQAPDARMAVSLLNELANQPALFELRQVDKPLALYGAGNLGKMARAYFDKLNIPFQYVVDAKPEIYRADPFWMGVNIVSSKDVPMEQRKNTLLAICIATTPYSEIFAALLNEGWEDVVPFYDLAEAYRDHHPLGNGWSTGGLDYEDVQRAGEVLHQWKDDVSRAHHLQFIAWHHLREDWFFEDAPVTTDDRYFIPAITSVAHGNEAFLDIGAHHAEVSRRFMQISGGSFKEIWMIEPDVENIQCLQAELAKDGLAANEQIHLLTCAVGEYEGDSNFVQGLGYSSQLSELGKEAVEVRTIDQMGLAPTFIKLHLEGAELAALKGSIRTIERCRPLIAATAYHNRLGIWKLPKWMMDNLPDYRFLLRLHSWCGTGAVIYAIPNKRLAA